VKDETKATLQLFVTKARELQSRNFVRYVKEKGFVGIRGETQSDGTFVIEVVGPDEEGQLAFLPTFRLFVQKSEPISFRALVKLIHDPGLSKNWKTGFAATRDAINRYLDDHPDVPSPSDEPSFTRRDIMNVFISGDVMHVSDKEKRETFERWLANDFFFLFLTNEFNAILLKLYEAIVQILELSERELGNNV
jgi:hypothetical protein